MNEEKNDDEYENDPVVKLLKLNMLLCDFNDALMSDSLQLINDQIKHLQNKLIYLEKPECIKSLSKQIIEDERRDTTNRFKLLINKRHRLLNMGYNSSSEEENSK
jgi:hypothetical protein